MTLRKGVKLKGKKDCVFNSRKFIIRFRGFQMLLIRLKYLFADCTLQIMFCNICKYLTNSFKNHLEVQCSLQVDLLNS